MERFCLIILQIYLLLCPFYLFPSGQPQPADYLLASGSVVLLLSGRMRKLSSLPIFKALIGFVAIVVVVNLTQWFYNYAIKGVANQMYYYPFFYIYNALVFCFYLHILKGSRDKYRIINQISLFLIFSLTLQFILAILGIHGGATDLSAVGRTPLFFNNPNQLGYYVLLMFSIYSVLPSIYRKNKLILLLVLFMSGYLIFLSGSRAALGGLLLLTGITLYNDGLKLKLGPIVFLVIIAASLPYLLQTEFIQTRIDLIEQRNARYEGTDVTQAEVRGYDRFWLYPEYLFFGAGEGLNTRFESYHQGEMHSGIGVVLFGYGIVGLLFFLTFLYKSVSGNLIYNLSVLLPVFFYNLTHQGLRNSLFWIFIACLFYFTEIKKDKSNEDIRM